VMTSLCDGVVFLEFGQCYRAESDDEPAGRREDASVCQVGDSVAV